LGESNGGGRILVGKPNVRRPFGRPRLKWEYNIRKDPQKLK